MKYLIDIRAYHFVIRTLPKILPEGMWNILGSIFFILFMQYAKFLRPVFFGTPSERYIEYSWANMNLRGRRLKILDVGCGDSLFDYKLKNLGHDVSGIDLLSQDINKKSKYNFIQGDIVQAPFKDDAFDRIHALSSIEHIDEGKTGLSVVNLQSAVIYITYSYMLHGV